MLSRFPKCFALFDLNSLYLALRSAFSNHTSRFFCGAIRNSKKSNVYSNYSKYWGFLLKVLFSELRWARKAFNFKKRSRQICIPRNADGSCSSIYFILILIFISTWKSSLLVTSGLRNIYLNEARNIMSKWIIALILTKKLYLRPIFIK